jgi:hypothetical protein
LGTAAAGVALLAASAGLALSAAGRAADAPAPAKRVVELFTSQGCSSCPPADLLLETYKARGDIIALSLPVDYWDRLGWKDTFASRKYSDRQRAYAFHRGDNEVYTPQVVVDGRVHTIGSVPASIDRALSSTAALSHRERVALEATMANGSLSVTIGAAPAGTSLGEATVLLASVQDSGTVAIGRGENAGRRITYHNVVRGLRAVGTWNGGVKRIDVPLTDAEKACCSSVVILLQKGASGPILAAEQVAMQ